MKYQMLGSITVGRSKEVIDQTVKESVSTRLWLETLVSSKTFKHWTPEKTSNRP